MENGRHMKQIFAGSANFAQNHRIVVDSAHPPQEKVVHVQHFPLKPVTEELRSSGLSCGVCLQCFKKNQLVSEMPCKVSVADISSPSVNEKGWNHFFPNFVSRDKFYFQHHFHPRCIQNGFDVPPVCETCRQVAKVSRGTPTDQADSVIAIRNFWVCGDDDNLIIEGDVRNGKSKPLENK